MVFKVVDLLVVGIGISKGREIACYQETCWWVRYYLV